MEKKRARCNEMYQYTTTGSTLYDLLGEYIDQTDFSAKAILNTLRRDLNMQLDCSDRPDFKGLANVYNNDIHGKIVDSMLQNMTSKDKEEILEKLRAVNPEKYNLPGLLEYIGFLQDTNFTRGAVEASEDSNKKPVLNQDIDELNTILIDTAVDKADPELVSRIRNVLIHMMLIPYARKKILRENPERDETKNPKLHKIQLLYKIFSNNELVEEYDKVIASTKQKEEEARKAAQLKIDCKLTRLAAVSDFTGRPVSELLAKVDSYDESILDAITTPSEQPAEPYFPGEGDYSWSFSPYKKPRVILDDKVEFSEDGDKDQEIIVSSFGDFRYGRNIGSSNFEELPMQLIGVTVYGKDENKNYFLVTPESNIINMRNGVDLEQYKKVLLSEFVLEDSIGWRDKFLPEMVFDEDGNVSLKYEKEITLLNSRPLEAVKYANIFKGSMGRGVPERTLQSLCNSHELFEEQMRLIQNLRSRERSTDRGENR